MPASSPLRRMTVTGIRLLWLSLFLSACIDQSNYDPPNEVSVSNEKPTATLSVADSLGGRETLVVTFSEPMDADTLQLGGSLVPDANGEWKSDQQLELWPETYWPPGAQTLSIDARDSEGHAMDTLHADVAVRSAFSTGQKADVVIGQQDFTTGHPRQDPGALSAAANTLDRPSSAVDYSEEHDILFIADTFDSRVLGFFGIPQHNNANADFVIGQDSFRSSDGETSQSKSRRPQGLSAQAGKLLVGDPDSHRILIYSPIPENGPGEAAAVLGQASFDTFENGCGPNSLNHSHNHFVTPSGKLLVADGVNNRVLVWKQIPDTTGVAPDLVIGQSGFETCAPHDDDQDGVADAGERPTARTLQHPTGIWSDDERLVIVDNYNNRVLIWNGFPQENFEPADIVLGQANMNSLTENDDDQDGITDAEASARVFNYPWSVWAERGQLFVADENNNRVLVWNEWPADSFATADEVIGQPDFSSNIVNRGRDAPGADTLNGPKGVRVVDDKLIITDTGNSRLLVFEAR